MDYGFKILVGRIAPKRLLGILATLASLVVPFEAKAISDLPLFGPKRYERLQGEPTVYTASFDRCEPSDRAILRIWNGIDKKSRITAAAILINQVEVFSEADFKQQNDYLEASIPVQPFNDVVIVLKGGDFKVPAFLRIEILGKDCDDTPPKLSVSTPLDGSILNDSRPEIAAYYADEAKGSGIDEQSLRLYFDGQEVTSLAVIQPDGVSFLPSEALTEEEHRVNVSVSDKAFNESSLSWRFTTDTVPPVPRVTSHGDGQYLGTSVVSLSGTLDEPVASITINRATAAVTGDTFSLDGVTLGEGVNTFAVTAVDHAGNSGSTSLVLNLDTIPPHPQITFPIDAVCLNKPRITIVGSIDEPVVFLTVNGSPALVTGNGFSLSQFLLNEGENILNVEAVDRAGNRGSSNVSVTLDTIPPSIDVGFPQAGTSVNTPRIAVEGTVDEEVTGITINGVPASVGGKTFSLSNWALSEGGNELWVRAVDSAGNETSVSVTVTLDTVSPVVTIESPPNGLLTRQSSLDLQGTTDEAILSAQVNGKSAGMGAAGFSFSGYPLNEGKNLLTAVVTDRAGNVGSAEIEVTLDTIPPDPPVIDPPASPTNNGDLSLGGSAEPWSTVRILSHGPDDPEPVLLGVAPSLEDGRFQFSGIGLAGGTTTISAMAIDAAGNESDESQSVSVVFDTVPPGIALVAPGDGLFTNQLRIEVRGVVDEPVREITVNGRPAHLQGQGLFLADLELVEGINSLVVRVVDLAGNTNSVQRTVIRDTVPPFVIIAKPLGHFLTSIAQVEVAGEVDEPVVSVTVNGVAADLRQQQFSRSDVSLAEGINILTVAAVDRAGNVGQASVLVDLDSIAPEIPVFDPPATPTNVAGIVLKGISEPGSRVRIDAMAPTGAATTLGTVMAGADGRFILADVTLAEGSTSFTAVATDAAGNDSHASPPAVVLLDTKAPQITVIAPDNGFFSDLAEIHLTGILSESEIALSVDGVPFPVADMSFDVEITLQPGENNLVLLATDAAGNAGTAGLTVYVDNTPPAVVLTEPAEGFLTNNPVLTLSGAVGEPNVSLALAGLPLTLIGQSFSTQIHLIEGENILTVTAVDRAGNTGTVVRTVTLDSMPPALNLEVPTFGDAGTNLEMVVDVNDGAGLFLVEVIAGGVPIWSNTPEGSTGVRRSLIYTLSPALEAGSVVTIQARAIDEAGNQGTASAEITVANAAFGPGFLWGEVYDDRRGLRLGGAAYSLFADGASVASGFTDADGSYFLELPSGDYLLSLSAEKYTTVERRLAVRPEQQTTALDARLTPLDGIAQVVGPLGGTIAIVPKDETGPEIGLDIPVDALPEEVDLRMIPVSNQGLPGRLPSGWSPLAVVDLRAHDALNGEPLVQGVSLAIPAAFRVPLPSGMGIPAASDMVLAGYDHGSHAWLALGTVEVDVQGGTATAQLNGTGQFALLLADQMKDDVLGPTIGQTLGPVPTVAFDFAQLNVTGRVVPLASPPRSGLTAVGEVVLKMATGATGATLPASGLVLNGRMTERFDLNSGETVRPADYVQDLILYRAPCVTNPRNGFVEQVEAAECLRTTFPVSPSREYSIADLVLGKVGIEIRPGREENSTGNLVGMAGARLVDEEGNILNIPGGALAATTSVKMRAAEGVSALVGSGLTLLRGMAIDLGGQTLQRSAELSVPVTGDLDPALPLIVARRFEAGNTSRLKLVAVARLAGSMVVSENTVTARNAAGAGEEVDLPGITSSGTYLVLQAKVPVGYLRGTVRDNSGNLFAGALVTADSGSLADLTAGDGKYLVVLPAAPFHAQALDLARSNSGTAHGILENGIVLDADLTILHTPPRVTAVEPADGDVNVQPTQAIRVTFSEAVDRTSVSDSSIVVKDAGGTAVSGVLSFSADSRTVTFYPKTALSSETLHNITVDMSVKDLQGYPLAQPVTTSFTVRDTTPPPMPPAGSITASFPNAEGLITVTGTQGAAETDNAVLVINDTTGEIVAIQPGNDGGFTTRINAQLGDEVQVVLMDEAGNQTLISYLTFRAVDGRYLVTRKGGKVAGEGGSELSIPSGALVGPAVVRVAQVLEADLAHPVPEEARFLGAVKVDTGGINFSKEIEISIPVPLGMPVDAVPFVARPTIHRNADGSQEEVYVIVDSAKIVNGRLTTASPPFPGPMGPGIFAFLYSVFPVAGPVVVSGTTYRDMDGSASYTPGDLPIRGAVVRSPGSWNFISHSDAEGHYAAYGFTATGACRNFGMTAIHPLTMFRNSVNLTACNTPYLVSDLNFQLADAKTEIPDTAPPEISLGLMAGEGQDSKILAGTVPVGTELTVLVSLVDQAIGSATLTVEFSTPLMTSPQVHPVLLLQAGRALYRPMQGEEPAVYRYDFQTQFSGILAGGGGPYLATPQEGTYAVVVEATDSAGNRSVKRVWVRAVDPGVTTAGIEGSPQVDELLPANGSRDVMVNSLVTAVFSEPVENVTQESFQLIDLSTGLEVPAYVTSRFEDGRMVATLAPTRNLYYDRGYEIILRQEIIDAWDNQATPSLRMPLDREYRARFHTKAPKDYGLSEEEQFPGGFDIAHFTSYSSGHTYSYVTAGEHGWRVIDVTDPKVPTLVFERNTSGPGVAWNCRGIAVDQQTAVLSMTENIRYSSGGQYGYVRFFRLYPDGSRPVLIGKEKLAENFSGLPGRIALYGRFAYVATVGVGLQVVDVEAARNHVGSSDGSTIVGIFDTIGQGYGHPSDILVWPGGRGLLTTTTGHLLLLDLSLPQMPRLINAFNPAGFHASRVAVADDFVFSTEEGFEQEMDLAIVTGRDGVLRTLDLTDLYNPRLLGVGVDELGDPVSVYALDLAVSPQAGLAFLTTFNAVLVFDIRDPVAPTLLARIAELPGADGQMGPIGAIPALVEKGGWVFLADRDQGFRALDLDPVSIQVKPRVVILDQNNHPLQNVIGYDIHPKDAHVSGIEVGLFEVIEGGRGRKVRSWFPVNEPRRLDNAVSIAELVLEEGKSYYAQVLVNEGTGLLNKSVPIPFIQQAVLIPDYDHDREIDPEDRERARRGDRFYFWINDDDDWGETEGSDIPGDKGFLHFRLDFEDKEVDGVRDLVDFFPLLLDLQNLIDLFPPHQYKYLLRAEDESVNIVLTDLKAEEAGFFLVGDENGPERSYPFGEAKTHRVTKEGLNLYNLEGGGEFFDRLLVGDGQGVILVEGCRKSALPLRFEILDEEGNKYFWADLAVSLDGVEQMFRHKNLIGEASGQTPETGTKWGEEDRLDEPSNCPDHQCLNTDGSDFVFVHGYNVDGQQARGWQAEIFKRMFWSGSRARFWGVSWYGSESQFLDRVTFNYQKNVQHAFRTAPAFREFLNGKVKGPISLAAHSLGNMLVSSCLADQSPTFPLTANVRNFFLIDAAMALEAYIGGSIPQAFASPNLMVPPDWYDYDPRLASSEWHRLFEDDVVLGEPDARATLTWRDRFAKLPEGITYFNFYSSGEEVLDFHEGDPDLFDGISLSDPGRATWALQEKLKGRMPLGLILSSRYGGWGFNREIYAETIHPDTEQEEERIWLPAKANLISDNDLRTKPFFRKSLLHFGSLFESAGPGNAQVMAERDKWLAEAFPALTGAAGGPDGGGTAVRFDPENVVDMQARFQNGWPIERTRKGDDSWRHSDIQEVSFLYIHKFFKNMVGKME